MYYTVTKRWSRNKNSATILAYHEICDLPKEIIHQHSYNVTPSAFREQMEFLCQNNYSVIKLGDLISCLTEKREVPYRSVAITFDDGYRNNYTNAFPVLKRFNFPATMFLATDYIGKNEVFPWFRDLCGSDTWVRGNWLPLSWEEVREMSQDGVTFGSHTCSHANIRQMSKRTFEGEVERSKEIIEAKINKKVDLFSYPFSFPKYRCRYRDITNKTKQVLLKRGFLGACTTIIGTNSLASDPFSVKRIQIKNTDDLLSFRAKVDGAYNWVGLMQTIYQKLLEPLMERAERF